jgi:hypothetical protein
MTVARPPQDYQSSLIEGPSEADLEEALDDQRYWQNEFRRRDLLGGCECKPGGTIDRWPASHREGTCDCWCAVCDRHRVKTAEQREHHVEYARLNALVEQERRAMNAAIRQQNWELYESPEARARLAAEKAEREEQARQRRATIKALREQMLCDGPDWGPLADLSDTAESYRRCAVWASSGASVSGDPEDRSSYGRLFLIRQGGKTLGDREAGQDLYFGRDALFEQVSDENCTGNRYHKMFRDRDPSGRLGPYCDAGCGSTFHLEQIQSLKQLDAYLERRGIRAFFLPPEESWARWFAMDIDLEVKERVWADQRWTGAWRLAGCRPPAMRSATTPGRAGGSTPTRSSSRCRRRSRARLLASSGR